MFVRPMGLPTYKPILDLKQSMTIMNFKFLTTYLVAQMLARTGSSHAYTVVPVPYHSVNREVINTQMITCKY